MLALPTESIWNGKQRKKFVNFKLIIYNDKIEDLLCNN